MTELEAENALRAAMAVLRDIETGKAPGDIHAASQAVLDARDAYWASTGQPSRAEQEEGATPSTLPGDL